MDALDGNAIGGLLADVFGSEMTATESICGSCGASGPVAELAVYRRAPSCAAGSARTLSWCSSAPAAWSASTCPG